MRKTPFLLIGLLLVSALAVNFIAPIAADEPRGTRNPGAGIEITAPADDTGRPTDTVTYDFDVKNVGDIVDNFTFTAWSDSGWSVNVSDDLAGPLDVNDTVTVSVNVTIPMGVAANTMDILNFRAGSETEPGYWIIATANTTVEAAFVPSIDIDDGYTKTLGIDPPEVANYTLTVKNKGNVNVTITLMHSTPSGGWQVAFPKYPNGKVAISRANATSEGMMKVNVTVTAPPASQPDDQMSVTIWGEKTDSPTWSSRDYQDDIILTTIVHTRFAVTFAHENEPPTRYADFSDTPFNFTVANSGNKNLLIDLTIGSDPLVIATLNLQQFMVRVGQLPVHNILWASTAANAPLGNYTINVTAWDHATGDYINSTRFYFIIAPRLNITKISVSEDHPLQFKEVTISALIENVGYVGVGNITVKFYDGSKKIGEKDINTSEGWEAKIKWSPSKFGNRTVWVKIDVDGEGGDGDFSSHGIDITESSVHIEVELNWQPYYFVIFVIIVVILGVAVVASLLDLRYYGGIPTGAGTDDYSVDYGEEEMPPEGFPEEEGQPLLDGEKEPAPFGTDSLAAGREEPFSYEREEREMFRPAPKPEPKPYERQPSPIIAEKRESRAPVRDHELKDEISRVKDKIYKTKSLGVDTANIDNLISMANRSLDAGDTDKTKQYLKYANERIDGIMGKREEALQAIKEAKEVLSGMRDSTDMTIVENFVVKADSLFEEGDFREAISYANKAKDRALRLQRREMRL